MTCRSGRREERRCEHLWGAFVSHPLIELAADREVRQSAAFREAAARLTGEILRTAYEGEKASAPRLADAGKPYFVKRAGKPATERKKTRDLEHLGSGILPGTPLASVDALWRTVLEGERDPIAS